MLKKSDAPSESQPVTRIDEQVANYIFLRDGIKKIEERNKRELAEYEIGLKQLAGELLAVLDAAGATSVRTAHGTVHVQVNSSVSCSDPDLFVEFVRANDAYELMDRRANKIACRAYAEENGSLPPGVRMFSERTVGVRIA